MTVKDVLLLYVTGTSPLPLGQNLNFKFLLIKKNTLVRDFFGYSYSEFMNKNSFHQKDKIKRYRDFKAINASYEPFTTYVLDPIFFFIRSYMWKKTQMDFIQAEFIH